MRMLLLALVFVLIPLSAAHLDGGMDAQVGDYLVDLGYSPSPIMAGELSTLSLNLINQSVPIDPQSVWVRISKGDMIAFSGAMHPEGGQVLFTFIFPEPGSYEVLASFREPQVQASFLIEVGGKPKQDSPILAALGIGVLCVALLAIAYRFYRK